MPGKAKGYSDFYQNREEMSDTIIPKDRAPNQEAAIMYDKQKKGKISKDTLKRRLEKIYGKREG